MKRRLIIGFTAVAVAAGVYASAAALNVSGRSLGAGGAAITACDLDGVRPSYDTSFDAASGRFRIEAIVVEDIAMECGGQSLVVVLTAGGTTLERNQPIPSSAGTVEFPIANVADRPFADAVTEVDVLIASDPPPTP